MREVVLDIKIPDRENDRLVLVKRVNKDWVLEVRRDRDSGEWTSDIIPARELWNALAANLAEE